VQPHEISGKIIFALLGYSGMGVAEVRKQLWKKHFFNQLKIKIKLEGGEWKRMFHGKGNHWYNSISMNLVFFILNQFG
jgi:hypothetical protein